MQSSKMDDKQYYAQNREFYEIDSGLDKNRMSDVTFNSSLVTLPQSNKQVIVCRGPSEQIKRLKEFWNMVLT